MIRTEIFIENRKLELTKDISSEFVYSIDDISDFASRNTSYSKTIVIPGNATNNKLFGYVFQFTSANLYDPELPNVGFNFNAAKSAQCLVFIDRVQIFKGVIRLLEIVVDKGNIEYECAVFGDLGGFISEIANRRLEELDFSAYNHSYTIANIMDSWDNDGENNSGEPGSGYVYPLVDYGDVSTDKHNYKVQAFRPALHLREYLDKIITNAGYTYTSPFLLSDFVKREVITNNSIKLLSEASPFLLSTSAGTADMTDGDPATNVTFSGVTFADVLSEDTPNQMWVYNSSTTLAVTATGSINITAYGINNDLRVLVYVGGNIQTIQVPESGSDPVSFVTEIEIAGNLNTGDLIYIQALNYKEESPFELYVTVTDFRVEALVGSEAEIVYGGNVDMNVNLPRGVYQKDFFAWCINKYNLYVTEDRFDEKHLIIEPYIDFYERLEPFLLKVDDDDENLFDDGIGNNLLISEGGLAAYLDWTYKVDRELPMRIKPMSEVNGRYYEYKYKQDSDYYNDLYQKKYNYSYGDRVEDTGFEFAKDKESLEIGFSPTILVGYTGEDKIVPTIFKKNANVEERIAHNIRVMQYKKIACTSYNILNGVTVLASPTYYCYAGHLDDPYNPTADLNFGVPAELFFESTGYTESNMYNVYWSSYMAEIIDKDSKLLSCNIYLTPLDVFSLNFAKMIWIDGALWRLNKVDGFDPLSEDSTPCEFLRVVELEY